MTVFVQRTDGSLVYTFDWEDDVPADVTLDSVTHTADALTIVSQTTDSVALTSAVQVTGAVHGGTYLIKALALLSNGEAIPGEATLRVFDA